MNPFKKLISYFVLLFVLSSCEKEEMLSSSKEIETFKIEASLNSNVLKKDIEGVIGEGKIILQIPKEIDLTNIIATFTYNGKEILVGSNPQESTVTANDFSKNVVYTVVAADGSQADYPVVIEQFDDMGLVLTNLSLKKALNPTLNRDYELIIEENKITKKIIGIEKELIPTFETAATKVLVNGVPLESGKNSIDFSEPVTFTLISEFGSQKEYVVNIEWNTGLPHLFIITENNAPVNSKDDYVQATIKLDGADIYEDYEGTTRIRGRGNSTWGMPKKPYRLKLDNKASLLGLSAEKDWILLANYLDGTLMLNAVASKTAQLLEMPYTNTMIPVDVTLNGEYMGNYMFTEHKEVEKNRIDVTNGGILLELDTYFDEAWQFKSEHYELPVMIQYPELEDYLFEEATIERDRIMADFQILEDAVFDESFPNNNYLDYIDANALVNYLIVYNLTRNVEINHPKSTYLHKQKDGKYMMGPIWDFDWAFDYNGVDTYFQSSTGPLFRGGNESGTRFFSRFLEDPTIQDLYRDKWSQFKSNKLPELLSYIDEYAALIEISHALNYQKWQRGSGDIKEDLEKLRSWVENRASYIDDYVIDFK